MGFGARPGAGGMVAQRDAHPAIVSPPETLITWPVM